MEFKNVSIIRSIDKKITNTANSKYVFHFSSYPNRENISLYEGHFKNIGQNKSLHYHKIMTEIFTVLQGEFSFSTSTKEYLLHPNDTIIIPPFVAHGFNAKLPDSSVQFIFTDITDREGFFQGLAKISNGESVLSKEELEAFYNRYDQYFVN